MALSRSRLVNATLVNATLVNWADASGRRNTLLEEVAMSARKRRSDRSGRPPLFSPGRPPIAGRDERRRFWAAIAAGLASEDAAVEDLMSVSGPGESGKEVRPGLCPGP